ncbi:MAG: hypothetical protein LIP03_02695 [Bacteroidales bacterium]|nr:hypothetical protein [Bacteroidales bacterium]
MRKLCCFALLSATALSMWAGDIAFTYSAGGEATAYGTGKGETYEVGICLPAADYGLIGKKITAMSVPASQAENLTDFTCWITTSLDLVKVDGKNTFVPDLSSDPMRPDENGMLTWTLSEPYLIEDDEVFAGYEVAVDILDDDTKYPILVENDTYDDNGFWIRATRSYTRFTSLSVTERKVLPLVLTIEGDFTEANAVIELPETQRVSVADPMLLPVTVRNRSLEPITSLTYKYSVAGLEGEKQFELATPIQVNYNYATSVTIELPRVEHGEYDVEVALTQVNGEDNLSTQSAQGGITVLSFVPKKRPLMEEFTGTWCGYCPKGFVALEKMSELYPDDFIGVAYHDGDPMLMKDEYPDLGVPGFPAGVMDRVSMFDPYEGEDGVNFGIEATWLRYAAEDADFDIDLDIEWDNAQLNLTSEITWAVEPEEGSQYMVNYILVADGLYGENERDRNWWQNNYYSGDTSYMPYMEMFQEGDSYVAGLTFDHVAVLMASKYGLYPIIKSDEFEVDVPYQHTYTLNTENAVNSAGTLLIQDYDQLHVVAMLIDQSSGAILNAVKKSCGKAPEGLGGVASAITDRQATSSVYYDLQGRPVSNPATGIYIRTVRYTDGTTESTLIKH